jgi:hypothetical protein
MANVFLMINLSQCFPRELIFVLTFQADGTFSQLLITLDMPGNDTERAEERKN